MPDVNYTTTLMFFSRMRRHHCHSNAQYSSLHSSDLRIDMLLRLYWFQKLKRKLWIWIAVFC